MNNKLNISEQNSTIDSGVTENYMNCIISEDYFDLIINYESFQDSSKSIESILRDVANIHKADYYQVIDERYMLLYINKVNFSNDYHKIFESYHRRSLPTLFSLCESNNVDEQCLKAQNILYECGILDFHKSSIPLTGQGVLVGFVDTGIDYTHPVFSDADGSSKIINIWDQSKEGDYPNGFGYGTEYKQEKINEALKRDSPFAIVPHKDENGHGTFIAGITCGYEDEKNNFVGAAKNAEIIMVKLKEAKKCMKEALHVYEKDIQKQPIYQSFDIIMAVKYLVEKADALKRPLVIVLGVGSNMGLHDGSDILETYLSRIGSKAGIVVVTAAGDEADKQHHCAGKLSNENKEKDIIFHVDNNEQAVALTIIGNSPDILSIGLSYGRKDFKHFKPDYSNPYKPQYSFEKINLSETEIIITMEISDITHPKIDVYIDKPLSGEWTIHLKGEVIINGSFNVWMHQTALLNSNTRILEPSPSDSITIMIPSTTDGVITVGNYNSNTKAMSSSSGRGFTNNCKIKPDLIAPGTNICGPNTKIPKILYTAKSGTSVAAGYVAGAAALLLEWGFLSGFNAPMNTLAIKEWLIRGAKRYGFYYPNKDEGYGKLDLKNAMDIHN